MIKFFWWAIATVLASVMASIILVPNIQADDNTSNNTLSITDNSISNDVSGNTLPVVRELETLPQPSKRDMTPVIKSSESWERTRQLEVKSIEPTFNIKQTEDEHVKQGNWSMYAIDLTTSTGDAYFPKSHNEYVLYHIWEDSRLWNYVIIRHWTRRWVYGHTVTSRLPGSYVRVTDTNNVIWQYNRSWISTGPHVHIERWDCPAKDSRMRECRNVSADWKVAERNQELIEQRGWSSKVTQGLGTKVAITDEKIVVACLNENNMTIHPARNTGLTGCFLGKGGKWKNIMLPSKKDIKVFKKTFWDDYKYRLAIANFEGGFDENAGNKYAKWYLQTLRTYNIPNDIVSQLNWLKKREDWNTGVVCNQFLTDEYLLHGTMNIAPWTMARYTCMARWHYGFHKPSSKYWEHSVIYARRYKVVTEFYLSIDF